MTISSRTPEGDPHICPICGGHAFIESSEPAGDSCCPACGALLWKLRDAVSRQSGISLDKILLSSTLEGDLGFDSLEFVELVMELEEEFDIDIPDADAEQIKTVADAIRFILRRRRNQQ